MYALSVGPFFSGRTDALRFAQIKIFYSHFAANGCTYETQAQWGGWVGGVGIRHEGV